ncbi:MAG: glyoxalase superfamily protein [Hyphomicrobiaceae bacterium]
MADDRVQLTQSTPVLGASDYERARLFYRDQLGFSVVEEGGEPPRFGIFRRDRALLYVDSWKGARQPVRNLWSAYIHVTGLAGLAQEFQAAGVTLTRDITETVYGMREFEVTDPDGNIVCFGEDIE